MGLGRFELPTYGLGNRRSIHLSYSPAIWSLAWPLWGMAGMGALVACKPDQAIFRQFVLARVLSPGRWGQNIYVEHRLRKWFYPGQRARYRAGKLVNWGGTMDSGKSAVCLQRSSGRRRWIVSTALGSTGMLAGSRAVWGADGEGLSHSAEAIHQEIRFKASPERVYESLLDAKQFQKVELLSDASQSLDISGKPAQINREPGGNFSIFADYIVGRQIELVPNQRIVQAWRTMNWASGVYSIAKFEFSLDGPGTRLVFDHTGFPAGTGEHLATGWKAHYWDPLGKYLA